jgi:RimJ/RimL family protein N-acetyltransferase
MGEEAMNNDLFKGTLLRLSGEDPQIMAEAFSRWNCDSEYYRLLDTDPPRLWSVNKIKEWLEKDQEKASPNNILFGLRTLADDKLIGFIAFDGLAWRNRDTFVAIALGERDYWGKGYGTEAMQLMLRYGFTELNLNRVSLSVFEYNPRAIRSYEKCGFKHEGHMREAILRDGKRYDLVFMGILAEEWIARNKESKSG